MDWQEFTGTIGSLLMFSTFWMKTMIPLRLAGIAANCAMIVYAASLSLWPILAMQCLMLPVNIYRLLQLRGLLLRVADAADGGFRPDALIPFMNKEKLAALTVIFRSGDPSDKLYLIKAGRVRLEEIDHVLDAGSIFGEIGILSEHNERMASAICDTDCELLSITRSEVQQLFFQHPDFGFFLMRLVTGRLLERQGEA